MSEATIVGAHWVRAALQVNPFGYVGRNSPSKAFADKDAYNAAILDRCVAEGIDLIAVTDHRCIDTAKSLIEAAADRGIAALPGFEANSAEGVHLLVLFELGTDFADINAAIGVCGATPGCANGTTGAPYKDLLSAMDERGALVIPAHVNVANGGMLTGRNGPPLVKMVTHPDLHAIAVTPGQPAAADQEAVCSGRKPYDRIHPLSVIYADDISRPDGLAQPGATTWFKVSFPPARQHQARSAYTCDADSHERPYVLTASAHSTDLVDWWVPRRGDHSGLPGPHRAHRRPRHWQVDRC